MIVKKIRTEDFYHTLLKWSIAHEFPKKDIVLDINLLPEYVYVCYLRKKVEGEDGFCRNIPIYSVFVYPSNPIVWLAYPMSNMEIVYRDKKEGLKFLFDYVETQLKQEGFKILFTTSDTERVEKALWDCNYQKGDEKVTHYQKLLWEQHQPLEQQ